MERKLWLLDLILILYFIFITYFEKPFWCIKKGDFMVNECTEDIYGNTYNLLFYLNFNISYTF